MDFHSIYMLNINPFSKHKWTIGSIIGQGMILLWQCCTLLCIIHTTMGSTYEPTKHNIVILLILIIKICNEMWITWSNKFRQKKCIKIRSTQSFNCVIAIDYFKTSFIFESNIYMFTKFPNCPKKKKQWMLLWNRHHCEQKLWQNQRCLDSILLTSTCTIRNHGFSKGWTWLKCSHWPKGC
jgi:hypothetical protein